MILEIISFLISLAIVVSKNCSFLTIVSIFLMTNLSLRLICNGAILFHGLGHTIAIAAVDGDRSAMRISNVLEHRTPQQILQSLLPGKELFAPILGAETWLAAGDRTPWRIRLKAIGGIAGNLIAIAIVVNCFDWSNWFVKDYSFAFVKGLWATVWISANLAIAFSSLTDIIALFTGIAQYFYCGNFGFICQRAEDDAEILLPERMVNMYYQMGRETEIRGEQAGGGLVIGSDRDERIVFVGKKVVNRKRDNYFALQDFIRSFWSRRTNLTFPRPDAL